MFCMHCGTENSDTAKFCYKCGSRLYPQENETAQSPTGSKPWDDGEEETVLLKRNVETQNRQMEKETLSEETPDSQKGQPDPHGAAYFQEDFIPDGFVPMTSRPEDRKQKEKQAKAKAPRKGKKKRDPHRRYPFVYPGSGRRHLYLCQPGMLCGSVSWADI